MTHHSAVTDMEIIGRGTQGVSYTGTISADSEKCVVKVIECADLNYANLLFQQLMKLKELDHKNIIAPSDVFITWKEDNSIVAVNVIYPFFPAPCTLEHLIAEKIENQDNFSTSDIQKAIGQLVDALSFAFDHGILHLNLKPSNIFYSDEQFMIRDFGLPALVSDIATRTRTTGGRLYKYTELEYLYRIIEEPKVLAEYRPPNDTCLDSKTDVFSLGLLIYQMNWLKPLLPVDTSICRDSAKEIEDPILSGLLDQMIDPNAESRPSIASLAALPEIVHLMDLSERERIKQKRLQSAKVPHKLVPMESPIEVVIANLGEAWKSEELTRASFRAIYAASARATATFSEEEKKIIIDAATFHEEVQDIQEKFLAITYNLLALVEEESDIMCSERVCKHVLAISRRYASMENLIYACLQVLLLFTSHSFGASNLCRSKSLPPVMQLMEKYPGDKAIAIRVVNWIVWAVAANRENRLDLLGANAPQKIYSLMTQIQNEDNLLESYTACLWSLSSYRETLEDFKKHKGVDFVLNILNDCQTEPRVLRNCCMTLANVVEMDEVCAYSVLASNVEDPFALLRNLYHPNRDNPEFVESYITLLAELANYDEIRYELHRTNFMEICGEVDVFYQASPSIMKNLKRCVDSLNAYKL